MNDMKLIMENWRKFQESEAEEQINEAPPEILDPGTDPMAGLALSAQGRFRAGDIEGGLKDLEAFKKGSEMQGELASLLLPIGGTATIAKYANKLGGTKFVKFLKKIFGKGEPTGGPIKNRPGFSFNQPPPGFKPGKTVNLDAKNLTKQMKRQGLKGDSGLSPKSQQLSKKQFEKPPVDTQGSTASMKASPDANLRLRRNPNIKKDPIDNRATKVDLEPPKMSTSTKAPNRRTEPKGSKLKDRKTDPKGSK